MKETPFLTGASLALLMAPLQSSPIIIHPPMLQSMALAGFRSYSHDKLEVLSFETPLTLILGENGTGKTVPRIPLRPSSRR